MRAFNFNIWTACAHPYFFVLHSLILISVTFSELSEQKLIWDWPQLSISYPHSLPLGSGRVILWFESPYLPICFRPWENMCLTYSSLALGLHWTEWLKDSFWISSQYKLFEKKWKHWTASVSLMQYENPKAKIVQQGSWTDLCARFIPLLHSEEDFQAGWTPEDSQVLGWLTFFYVTGWLHQQTQETIFTPSCSWMWFTGFMDQNFPLTSTSPESQILNFWRCSVSFESAAPTRVAD